MKRFTKITTVALLSALSFAPMASELFTINDALQASNPASPSFEQPFLADGVTPNPNYPTPMLRELTRVSGDYNEFIQVGANTSTDPTIYSSTFQTSIYLQLSSLIDPSQTTLTAINTPGLNLGNVAGDQTYQLYSVINIEGNISADLVNNDINFGNFSGDFSVFYDAIDGINGDAFTFTGLNGYDEVNNRVTLNGDSDDILLATAMNISGAGNIGDSSSFRLSSNDFMLTASGEDFFVAPRPFHMDLVSTGNLTGIDTAFVNFLNAQGGPNAPTSFRVDRAADIVFVSEPSIIAVFGLALLGLGFRSRMKR